MLAFAYVALFGIPLLAAWIIVRYRATASAVAAAVVGGWLAMPLLQVRVPGVPILDKASLLAISALLATWLGRPPGTERQRLRWFDLPVVVWSLVPLASSISNDLGVYDGCSAVFRQSVLWGAPYAIGRMVCVDRNALTDVGRVLLLGAVAYCPLCLAESRLAPQLHLWVFGMPGRAGWETVDFYGPLRWKASVFLESPLELTPLMGVGFLFGWWMWYRRRLTSVASYPLHTLVPIALLATLMGKSLGGVTLTLGSALVLWTGHRFRTRAALVAMLLVAPSYIASRTTGTWSGLDLVEFLKEHVSERRAGSLETRLVNEDLLYVKALDRPVFGWGGWGRNRVYDDEGNDRTITDGFWVIVLGCSGFVGLLAWLGVFLLPAALALSSMGTKRSWLDPSNAILSFAAVTLILHTIDCLANAMCNPIYPMVSGGLISVLANARAQVLPSPQPRSPGVRIDRQMLRPRANHRGLPPATPCT